MTVCLSTSGLNDLMLSGSYDAEGRITKGALKMASKEREASKIGPTLNTTRSYCSEQRKHDKALYAHCSSSTNRTVGASVELNTSDIRELDDTIRSVGCERS